ncbi:WD40 repeat domain-containing protein [bacterium]|nr:WD40 repeat domain-containing protein [bacterium]
MKKWIHDSLSLSTPGLLSILVTSLLWTSTLCGQTPPVTAVVFTPDGKSIVSCSQTGLQVFSWPDLQLQKTVRVAYANIHCMTFSPDGQRLATGGGNPSEEGVVEVFAWPECISEMQLSNHSDSVTSIAWRGNNQLVSASLDRSLSQWNLRTKKAVNTYLGHSRGVSSVCILNSGEMVTAGHDQSVRVWHAESGNLIRSMNQHSMPVNSMALCPASSDKPMVATAAKDRTIRFWQPTIGRMMRYVRLESEPLDIAWISDSLIAASCVDGQTRVVDAENVNVLQSIPVFEGWAYTVAHHPNDGTLAIGGSDGQIQRVTLKQVGR